MPVVPLLLAVLTAMPSCWNTYDKALARSAASAHPPYITYSEHVSVTADGKPLISSIVNVAYRDDGLARIADERFNYDPMVTRNPEPGPPELGPYGGARTMWLPSDPGAPTIGKVRAAGTMTCTLAGVENVNSRPAYHLVFSGADAGRPHLDDMWVDIDSYDIWRVGITGQITLVGDGSVSRGLGRFDVDLAYSGPYLVVKRVTWNYRERAYSQEANYSAEYTFSGFSFPKELPASYFSLTPTAQ